MLKFVQGDMFDTAADIRVNTVNCVGVMGAGVALAFKKRHPDMFRAYKKACAEGRIRPGEIDVWRSLTDWIINFPTKRHWRNKSRYEDIDAGLKSLRRYLQEQGDVRVALPALGCGHGGLDWTRVAEMIRGHLADLEAEILVFEPGDSRAMGRRAEELTRAQIPEGIRRTNLTEGSAVSASGIDSLDVLGDSQLLSASHVALYMSSKPTPEEVAAAKACLGVLAAARVPVSLLFGSRVAHELAVDATVRGSIAMLWAAQGIERTKPPRALHEAMRRGRLAIVSPSPSRSRWSRSSLAKTRRVQVAACSALLVTTPEPDELLEAARKTDGFATPTFFIRYQTMSDESRAKLVTEGARPIGKHRTTGEPNLTRLIQTLGRSFGREAREPTSNPPSPVKKRWGELQIPTSTAEAIQEAASTVEAWRQWPVGHVVQQWLAAARTLRECHDTGAWPGDPTLGPTEDQGVADFAEKVMSPVYRVCRLARSLKALEHLGGAVDEEIGLLLRGDHHFHHAETVLHLATGLAEVLATRAAIVPRSDTDKRPDFDLPDLRISFEVKAKEIGNADGTHKKVFRSATKKFERYLNDKPGWHGVLALDLGFRGSPSLPAIASKGPDLRVLEANLAANLVSGPDAVLVLMNTVAVEPTGVGGGVIGPVETSLLVFSDPGRWRSQPLAECFHTEPDRGRIAVRGGSVGHNTGIGRPQSPE